MAGQKPHRARARRGPMTGSAGLRTRWPGNPSIQKMFWRSLMDTRVKPAYDARVLHSLLHPLETHALAVHETCRDVAAGKAGLALRHLFLRAAQRLPPRRPMRRARQRRVDDLLDLREAQHEFG